MYTAQGSAHGSRPTRHPPRTSRATHDNSAPYTCAHSTGHRTRPRSVVTNRQRLTRPLDSGSARAVHRTRLAAHAHRHGPSLLLRGPAPLPVGAHPGRVLPGRHRLDLAQVTRVRASAGTRRRQAIPGKHACTPRAHSQPPLACAPQTSECPLEDPVGGLRSLYGPRVE